MAVEVQGDSQAEHIYKETQPPHAARYRVPGAPVGALGRLLIRRRRWREIESIGPAMARPPGDAASQSDTSLRGRVGFIVKKLNGAALPEEDLEVAENQLAMNIGDKLA